MAIPCSCEGPADNCPHPEGLASCDLHGDRRAVAVFEGRPWCPECAATFTACELHPDHPGGADENGLALCQACVSAMLPEPRRYRGASL